MATVLYNEWKTILIVFDAAIETSREFKATVTSHPVETGVNINDHVTVDNPKFSVKGVISDAAFLSPSEQIQSLGNTLTSAVASVSNRLFGTNLIVRKESRSLSALQDLQFLLNSREFLTLQFGNEPPYTNLILTGLNVPKDKNVGDGYIFDLEFEQVRVVSSRYTTVQAKRIAKPSDESLSDKAAGKGLKDVPEEPLNSTDISKDATSKSSNIGQPKQRDWDKSLLTDSSFLRGILGK